MLFRSSLVAGEPSASDSALRCRQVPVRMSVVGQNSDRNLQLASQSRRRLPARRRVKRAARKKESKAPMLNLAVRHQEVERLLLADQPELEHLPREPSALRGSQNAARKSLKKNHHRQDHNNLV